jgi:hypothetical protein
MKRRIYSILIVTAFSVSPIIHAQQCDVYPADCPHEEMISNARDKDILAGNHLLPEEIDTQHKKRSFFTDYFTQLAEQQHWKLYEFNEEYAAAGCSKKGPVPFSTKAPCSYGISFLFIVNEDSLQAWKKWADDFKEQILQQSNDNIQSLQNNTPPNEALTKKYLDSAEYYGGKKTVYLQQHGRQYASDIQNGNQKGIKEFESTSARFDKIITGFTDRAYANTGKTPGALERQTSKNQLEEKVKTQHYRDAATLLIHLTFNNAVQGSGITDPGTQKYLLPQKKWVLPGAAFGGLLHNPLPLGTERLKADGDYDMDWVHPTDIGSIFFGSWLPLETQYNTYQAAFSRTKPDADCVSPKKYTCNKIQVMAIYIEGKEDNITRFVQSLDTKKINALVEK